MDEHLEAALMAAGAQMAAKDEQIRALRKENQALTQRVEWLERLHLYREDRHSDVHDGMARHCETNRHMETTREAHEDFCQLGRAIRALKGAKG